jgi:hypothetical protein
LSGTTKHKLSDLTLGEKLAQWYGNAAPKNQLLPDNTKGLCAEYHIDNGLDLARLKSYTS